MVLNYPPGTWRVRRATTEVEFPVGVEIIRVIQRPTVVCGALY